MSGADSRVLPIRVAPLPGEALDSWMEAYAARLDVTVGDLADAFGLHRDTPSGDGRSRPAPTWTITLRDEEVSGLAQATGIAPNVLIGLTLQRYEGVVVALDHATRAVRTWQLWGRGRGSRYCPACLADSGGRWQLAWRLSWSFYCLRHGLILVDRCPRCQRVPRRTRQRLTRIPAPGLCSSPMPSGSRDAKSHAGVCGFELATSDALALPAADPIARAQLYVNDLLTRTSPHADPVPAVDGSRIPVAEVFADLKALGGSILALAGETDLKEIPPPVIEQRQAATRAWGRSRRTGLHAPPDAASTAIAVSRAMQIVTAPDLDTAADRIGWLIGRARDRPIPVTPTAITKNWGTTSLALQRVILRALAPQLRPVYRLRYGATTPQPRIPDPVPRGTPRSNVVSDQIRVRATKLPQQLWASWALRLMPPSGYDFTTFRTVASTCLLVPGNRSDLPELIRLLEQPVKRDTIHHVLNGLSADGVRDAVLRILSTLASRLDREPVPIDYQRRRVLVRSSLLLTGAEWKALCLQTGAVASKRTHLHAQRYLFELLTGTSPRHAHAPLMLRPGQAIDSYATFCTNLTPRLAELLKQVAERRLVACGVREPAAWEPPFDWVDEADWPGPELDAVSPTTLHRLLVHEQLSLGEAAVTLGTSLDHVRLVLVRHPIGALATLQDGRARQPRRPRPRQLTPEYVAWRYRDCGLSYRKIAQEIGTSEQLVTKFGRLAAVQSRPYGPPPKYAVDPAWLTDQYLAHQRTLTDIATELGMHQGTLRKIAQRFGIPLRPRGSRGTILDRGRGEAIPCPAWMRAAFQGHGALQRIERFIRLCEHPNVTQAAQALQVTRCLLAGQLRRLESDVGVQLLTRATRTRPMRLTSAGRKFLRQARTVMARLHATGVAHID
jgi:TniQ/Bacterial regulatory helix-turn-helix protein, lysR family